MAVRDQICHRNFIYVLLIQHLGKGICNHFFHVFSHINTSSVMLVYYTFAKETSKKFIILQARSGYSMQFFRSWPYILP